MLRARIDHHHYFETPLGLVVLDTEPKPHVLPVAVWVSSTTGGVTIRAKGPNMSYTLPNDLQVLLKVQYVDSKGHPAKVDGDPEWQSSDPGIAVITPTPGNPFLATLSAGGTLGNAQVTVTADADMGEGVRALTCFLDVTIIGGEAVAGVISPASDPAPPSPGGG